MIFDPTTVLYAEDLEEDIYFMKQAFERSGVALNLKTVRNGVELIHYLSGKGSYANRKMYPLPFLILLDLKMPLMGGLEALEWIRGRVEFQTMLVYVLTSSLLEEDRAAAMRLGADHFLVKQTNFSELLRLVRALPTLAPKSAEFPTAI